MSGKTVTVQLVSSPGCTHCAEVRKILDELKPKYPGLTVEDIDITTSKGTELAVKHTIMASPGVIVNGELFSTGGLNKDKFVQNLELLTQMFD